MDVRRSVVAVLAVIASQAHAYPGGAAAPLPEGRLMALSSNANGASFVALDQSSKHGTVVDAWVMRVFAKPVVLSGPHEKVRAMTAQSFTHWSLDCIHRTARRISDDGFDAAGNWVIAGVTPGAAPHDEPIEANSAQDFLAKVMCDGQRPPQEIIVTGHAAAVELMRQIQPPGP